MITALWITSGVLAAVFLGSGAAKLVMTKEALLASGQSGVAPFPLPVIRLTAAAELLAAVGLILPVALGVATVLTPLAAVGLMIVMLGAAASHLSLREYPQFGINALLFAAALFVALGRF